MNFWTTSLPEPTTLTGRFAAIIDGIGRKIGAQIATHRHLEPILALAYHYLRRTISRLERLVARVLAGKHIIRRRPASARNRAVPPTPRPRLPSRNGWLVHLAQPTAQHIGHLETLVASPEMRDLIVAAPQAGRILRPLFRMYALPMPEMLRLPPRPPRPRPARAEPAIKPASAQERRAWLNYSPGRIGAWAKAGLTPPHPPTSTSPAPAPKLPAATATGPPRRA